METNTRLEELLNEEVRPEELREVLQKLGQEEFGGPENSRVRDIVEATGREPIDVARILAEVRKEDWEEKFGRIVEDHGERIEKLEEHTRKGPRIILRKVRASDEISDPYLQEARDRVKREHEQRPMVIAIVFMLLAFYIMFTCAQAPQTTSDPTTPGSTRIQMQDGTYRDVTPGERAVIEHGFKPDGSTN